jgi:hypothetical protein
MTRKPPVKVYGLNYAWTLMSRNLFAAKRHKDHNTDRCQFQPGGLAAAGRKSTLGGEEDFGTVAGAAVEALWDSTSDNLVYGVVSEGVYAG